MNRLRLATRVAVASSLIAVMSSQPIWAWGQDGHKMINRLAAQYLPADVPAFLRSPSTLDTMEYMGPEPDRWRNKAEAALNSATTPEHFLDMEWAEAAVPVFPKNRYDFIRALAAAQPAHPELKLTPENIGLQPWQVEEVWERLKVDFREYRKIVAAKGNTAPVESLIIFDAGWLGHYVADGSQPLHLTIQYNGWQPSTPNPNGYTTDHKIHSQFESVYVTANIKSAEVGKLVASSKPQSITDEWTQYLDYLHHSNSLVEKLYQLEKVGGFKGEGTPEAKTFTEERVAAGAIELRDLIYSAWLRSADPVEEYKGAK